MIFVFLTIIKTLRMGRFLKKEKEIDFYTKKLEEAKKSDESPNIRAIAYFVALYFQVAIIYYSVSVIFSFIKV